MKKILVSLLMLCALSINAQKSIVTVADKIGASYHYITSLNGTGDEHYALFGNILMNSFTMTSKDVLVVISKTGATGRKIEVNHHSDYALLTAYEGLGHIYCLYSMYKNSDKTYSLWVNAIPKDAKKGSWNPQQLVSFLMERRDDVLVGTAVSPDQSKAAVLLFQTKTAGFFQSDKTDKLKAAALLTFGEEGLIWSNDLELNVENSIIGALDIIMSNDASVFVALTSFEQVGDSRRNQTLHVFEINQNEQREVSERPDFGYVSMGKLLLTNSGNLVMGGYYSANSTKNDEGAYMMVFDISSLSLENTSSQKFSERYFEYKSPKYSQSAGDYTVYPMELLEFSTGKLALLGEPRAQTYVFTSTYTLTGNVLVNFADAQGNIQDFQMIEKSQAAMTGYRSTSKLQAAMCSYFAPMRNDEIQILFTDNSENYSGKSGKMMEVNAGSYYDKKCAAYCVISQNGDISAPAQLMNYKSNKAAMYIPLFIDEDGLWMYHFSGGMFLNVSKFLHQF